MIIAPLLMLALTVFVFAQGQKVVTPQPPGGISVPETPGVAKDPMSELFEQAVVAGDVGICRELLDKKLYYVNAADSDGMTQLHYAAMSGQLELSKLLLEHGAKADIMSRKKNAINYRTPVEAAIANDRTETALLLIDSLGPDALKSVRGRNKLPVFLAIQNGNAEILKALIKKGADVNAPERISGVTQTPLYFACAMENIELCKILLEANADINYVQDGIKASDSMFPAALSWNEDLCSFLIESKIDISSVNESGQNALHLLMEYPYPLKFYDKSSPFNSDISPFVINGPYTFWSPGAPRKATEKEDIVSICTLLTDAGMNINLRDKNDCTPIEFLIAVHGATQKRSFEDFRKILEFFIEKKVDLNLRDKHGWTPLNYYLFWSLIDRSEYDGELKEEEINKIAEQKMELFKKLVEAGADVKIKDKKGNNLLHYVVGSPKTRFLRGRYELDLSYETRGKHRQYTRQLLEFLLSKEVSLSEENNDGETPFDWAMRNSRDNEDHRPTGNSNYGGIGGSNNSGNRNYLAPSASEKSDAAYDLLQSW